jgi:tetratricopeptide (TPR) repeat protein
MTVPPPRRRYAAVPERRGPATRDTTELVQHILPAALGFGVGMVWVVWLGFPLYVPVLTAVGVWAFAQAAVRAAAAVSGRYTGLRGGTTPPKREYSAAQALVAQGRYHEAVAAYEIAAAESDGDPTPYAAIARIQRDHLGDYAAAAAWFRRTRRDARLGPGEELLLAQELIELYTTRLGEPRRAIPELVRITQLLPGSPQAAAAEREIAALRAALRDDEEDPD